MRTLLAILLLSASCFAVDRNAATCSFADVNTAYTAAGAGDRVVIPACGSTTWASTLTVSKSITVIGQTTCTGRAQTLACVAGTTINTSGIQAIIVDAANVRVTGLTLTGGVNGGGIIESSANASNYRIDHMRLTASLSGTQRGAFLYGVGSGLVDHVYVDTADGGIDVDGSNGDNGTYSICQSAGIPCDGTYSWAHANALGDSSAVYIEDCYFDFATPLDGAYDTYAGARLVFRFNYVSGANVGGHGLDSGGQRATLRQELYRNTFANTSTAIYTVWNTRGGMHMLFGNTVTGNWGSFYWLQNYRSDASFTGWGTCDGTNAIDGNTTSQQGYPCRDQVGRGPETAPANDYPQKSAAPFTYSEPLVPGYTWTNNFKGSAPALSDITITASGVSATRVQTFHIIVNRDFYNEDATNCNTTACTQGVGIGTLAQAPATCTNGTGWWATNQGSWNVSGDGTGNGVLYTCSSNTWTSYYTPYTYPHPLQNAATTVVAPSRAMFARIETPR